MKKLTKAGKLVFTFLGCALLASGVGTYLYIEDKNSIVDAARLAQDSMRIERMRASAYRRLVSDTYIRFNNNDVVEYGTSFAPSWLIVSCSGKVNVEGEVNVMVPGEYTLHYTVEGKNPAFGLDLQKPYDKTVTVKDTTMPIIELNQDNITINAGEEIWEGANVKRAYDPIDGDLEYTIEGSVDPETAGTYTISIHASDHNGNSSSAQYTVTVKEKPRQVAISANGGAAPDVIYDFLRNTMGLNKAAACGIMGNMWAESNFIPTAGNYYYGICQWGGGRRSNLESWCSSNGYDYSTTEGQLAYMYHELQTGYSSCLNNLYGVSDSEQGAADAAIIFVHQFEGAASEGNRAALARGYYNSY